MTYKCKCYLVAFLSKNRLYSYIRKYYIKKITLFSNSIVASHICSVALISALEKLFNQIVASSITLVATVATIAINEISTSSYANKISHFASESQTASKLATNSLVPAKIATSTSLLFKYRAISSISSKTSSNSLVSIKIETSISSPLKHQAISLSKSLSTSSLSAYRVISSLSLEY